ncbi:MAG: hypothetical protein ACHP7N_06605 [Caulobacterales bacterium]
MKRLILGLATAATLAGVAPAAMADPWDHGRDRGWDHHRWDRDRGDHDRRWRDRDDWRFHPFFSYGYGRRVCAWRFGERVCWVQRF